MERARFFRHKGICVKKLVLQRSFEKDLKRIKSSGNINLSRLKPFIEYLVSGKHLDNIKSYLVHSLQGDYKGFFECHIKPDLLLIYQVTEKEIKLVRLGSHSELFE